MRSQSQLQPEKRNMIAHYVSDVYCHQRIIAPAVRDSADEIVSQISSLITPLIEIFDRLEAKIDQNSVSRAVETQEYIDCLRRTKCQTKVDNNLKGSARQNIEMQAGYHDRLAHFSKIKKPRATQHFHSDQKPKHVSGMPRRPS